jgi:hypothetical protein
MITVAAANAGKWGVTRNMSDFGPFFSLSTVANVAAKAGKCVDFPPTFSLIGQPGSCAWNLSVGLLAGVVLG